MINWHVSEQEADFILTTLNGQAAPNWTVMARAQLIQKLMEQSQAKAHEYIARGNGAIPDGGQVDPPPVDNPDASRVE